MSPVASALFTCAIKMDGTNERMARMDGELVQVQNPYFKQAVVQGMQLPDPNGYFSDWSFKYLHGRHWAPRELDCYLSFIQCLRNFFETDARCALILMGDVKLDDGIKGILERAMEHAAVEQREPWEMVACEGNGFSQPGLLLDPRKKRRRLPCRPQNSGLHGEKTTARALGMGHCF
jgi:GR25 family glycosyltransferase involved in LPS biosynthesis